MTRAVWQPWLEEWNRELLERFDPTEYNAFVDPAAAAAAATGWLGAPGANEADIVALEARIGRTLPSSYRTFLEVSNGFLLPGVIVPRVLPAAEVAWLRDANAGRLTASTKVSSTAAATLNGSWKIRFR